MEIQAVIQLWMVDDLEDGAACSGLGVWGAKNQPCNSCVEDGAGTHGAGFQGGIEGATKETIITQHGSGGSKGNDLGVRCGV